MSEQIQPIFLISLPRSGSTLLQKMLAVSPSIATVAEPWICLPLAALMDRTTMAAEYWHSTCALAIEDLVSELPGGEKEFREQIGSFVMSIYGRIASKSGASLFLDKTPRNYMITSFLAETFPHAKFIFLFRNPLEVFTSILRSWNYDRMSYRLLSSYVDFMRGPELMASGARLLGDRAFCLNYARLVETPNMVMPELCNYLGIDFSEKMLTDYQNIQTAGRMGDTDGIRAYDNVSSDSVGKWKKKPINIYRKWYMRHYIRNLGDDTLQAFGLTTNQLLSEIRDTPTKLRGTFLDAVGHGTMTILRVLNFIAVGLDIDRHKRQRPYLPYG